MTNPHFNASGSPGTLSRGRSAPIRSELANIEAGFDSVETLKADVTSPTLLGVPKTATPAVTETELTRLATVGFVLNYFGASVSTLPATAGHAGEILKTVDGISATWQQQYPTRAGNVGKYLRVGASTEVEWADPLPIGSVVAAYTAPAGYVPADGSVYLQATYPSLFAAIGHPPGYSTAATVVASLPFAASLTGVALSADGVHAVASSQSTPYLFHAKREGGTFVLMTTPGSAAAANDVALSPDGAYMAVAENGSPYIGIYKRAGDSWSRLANPGALPAGAGQGVAWTADGAYLAVAHTISPYVTIYSRAGDVFTKVLNPASLPAGIGRSCAFSADTNFLAVGHDTTPFVTVYSRVGDVFTKLADPASLPAASGSGVAWSGSDYMAVAHGTSPYVTIYTKSGSGAGSTLAKATNPSTLPTGTGQAVAGSADGERFFVAHSVSPYLSVYQRVSSTWSKMTDPAELPEAIAAAVALGLNDNLLAVGVQSAVRPHIVYSPWNYDSSTEFTVPLVQLGAGALSNRAGESLITYIRAE